MPDTDATILIVDDEAYNVDYLDQNLSDIGYQTRQAFGGREALDSVAAAPPDLILLDVMMPDIDGITVCQILKSNPETALIPIVIMTALDGQEDRIRGIEAGADDFLTKPVDERELLARINTLLRSKKAVDRTRGELESATAQLQDMGPKSEDVAVLAMEVRDGETGKREAPTEAIRYLRERYVADAVDLIRRHHGHVTSSSEDSIVAVIRTSSEPSTLALETAMAIREHVETLNRSNEIQPLHATIAVDAGIVSISAERRQETDTSQWVTEVTGAVIDGVRDLLAGAEVGTVVTTERVFQQARGWFEAKETGAGRPIEISGVSDAPASSTSGKQSRRLETIFVSDIVGSTEIATRVGDEEWTRMLDDHYRLVRRVFTEFQGEEVSTAGDGFLALFDVPAAAIRAGLAVVERSGAVGLPVRVGIHTGEVEKTDTDVQGIAVHLASRVSDQAGASEVLVTSTTREAVAGSGLEFTSTGPHSLKGIDGERELFRALP